MTAERDRLAVVLHAQEVGCAAFGDPTDYAGGSYHDDAVDRLIAAGVVLGNVTSTDIDVERLARALLRAVPGYERWLLPPPNSQREAAARVDAMNAEVRIHAAAIAAAYQEDR